MGKNGETTPFKTVIGALLVGGTALGAGMLALPVATGGSPLWEAWFIYFLCWIFSIGTGFLFLEVALWLPPDANISTMGTRLLGRFGKVFSWILYIFLFYSLTIAYVTGGGNIIFGVLSSYLSKDATLILFTLFFGAFVFLGTKIAGKLNALLMIGLIISYFSFVFIGIQAINPSLLKGESLVPAITGLPILFTSFSYQGVIPTLLHYLDRDKRSVKKAIVFGTFIPFIAYLIWDLIIKGSVPVQGAHGLLEARKLGMNAIEPMKYFLKNQAIVGMGNAFAFFALTTSFIGVSLGLVDFLVDSLGLEKKKSHRFWVSLLVFIPPLIISLYNPTIFLLALSLAGGFGCALLLGLLPVMMVWQGRWRQGFSEGEHWFYGRKSSLFFLFLFVVLVVTVEIVKEFILR